MKAPVLDLTLFFIKSPLHSLCKKCKNLNSDPDLAIKCKKIKKKELPCDLHVFDHLQKEVFDKMRVTSYPSFRQSEFFAKYYNEVLNGGSASVSQMATASTSAGGDGAYSLPTSEQLIRNSALQTLHEGKELAIGQETKSNDMPKLTHESLLATQSRRLVEVRPQG